MIPSEILQSLVQTEQDSSSEHPHVCPDQIQSEQGEIIKRIEKERINKSFHSHYLL